MQHIQARTRYDKIIASINKSISETLSDTELGDITGDAKSAIELIEDAAKDANYKMEDNKKLPPSSKLNDQQFERFFVVANALYLPPGQDICRTAYAGLDKSYRIMFKNITDAFAAAVMKKYNEKPAISKDMLNDGIRFVLSNFHCLSNNEDEEDSSIDKYGNVTVVVMSSKPQKSLVDILLAAYDMYKKEKSHYFVEYVKRAFGLSRY